MKERAEVLLDELLKDYQTPEQILGENGILEPVHNLFNNKAMKARLVN